MSFYSFIGSVCLILSMLGLILRIDNLFMPSFYIYLCFKVFGNIIWRCPKCKTKLPKGKYTHTIKSCSYCNYDLRKELVISNFNEKVIILCYRSTKIITFSLCKSRLIFILFISKLILT